MKIYLELYASLMDRLPPGKSRHRRELKIAEGAVVNQVIHEFGIPDDQAHIVLVNGRFVCGSDRDTRQFEPDDVLAIWPPVAGG
jgi:sulfur carrier protein ThiS